MSDHKHKQEPTNISQQPDAENKKSTELSQEALEKVTGGTSDIPVTRSTDSSSPKL
jgi:hypothetical protein